MDQEHPISEDKLRRIPVMEVEGLDDEIFIEASFQQILEHNCALRNNFEEVSLRS